MSHEPSLDLVDFQRRAIEAGSRRDIDLAMSFYGSDSIWDTTPLGMGVYAGRSEIRGFFEDWLASFEDFEMEPEELVDLGNGVGFGVVSQRGRPLGSESYVGFRYAQVVVTRDGVVAHLTTYADIDQARAAAEQAVLAAAQAGN
jgi:ketosteroid isomerase-like protein